MTMTYACFRYGRLESSRREHAMGRRLRLTAVIILSSVLLARAGYVTWARSRPHGSFAASRIIEMTRPLCREVPSASAIMRLTALPMRYHTAGAGDRKCWQVEALDGQ